jgi:hypothetical protein
MPWKGKVRKKERGEEDRRRGNLPAVEKWLSSSSAYRSQVLIEETTKDTWWRGTRASRTAGKRMSRGRKSLLKSERRRGLSPMGRRREIHGGEVGADAM